MIFTVPCPSTKGLPFSVVMATCNAPRDASDSRFRATPPVPFTTDAVTKPSLSGPGHKPHAQRHPSLDPMGVTRLHMDVAPGIRGGTALAGLDLGLYGRRNLRSRGSLTPRRPRVSASVILVRPHPSQQTAYLALGHLIVLSALATSDLIFILLRRVPARLPDRPGHIPSEGRIICRASRHLLRRATSFQRPIPTPSQLTFSSSGYFLFWKEKLFPLISEPLCAVYSEGS